MAAVLEPGPDEVTELRSRNRQRRLGQLMVGVAMVGTVVALVATVVGWIVLGQINDASENTVAITVESLDAVENTIDLADEVLNSTSQTVDSLEQTLTTVAASTENATGVVNSMGDLSSAAGPAFGNAADTLSQLSEIGDTIDDVLMAISRLPIGTNYQPDARFGDTLAELSAQLEPLPPAFETATQQLEGFSVSTEAVRDDVEALAVQVGAIGVQLEDRAALVDQYRRNVETARALGVETGNDLEGNLKFARIVIVIAGLNFALGQIVPFTYGRILVARSASAIDTISGEGPADDGPIRVNPGNSYL